jgi:MFS family permease
MAAARYLSLYREQRGFRVFWSGFAASTTADEITRIAFIWFVYEHTHSAAAVGWLMVCFTAPIIAGGFLAGWALDCFDRRRVMILDNLLRSLAIALVPLLALTGTLALWHLYAIAAVYGLLMMIPLAGAPALIPSLVPADRLQTANALEMLGFTLGGVIGPALGGVLIGIWGAPLAVLANAAVYLFFAWALWHIGPQLPPASPQAAGAPPGREGFGETVRLMVGNVVLLSTTLMFLTYNIGLGLLLVWLPVFSDRRLGGDAGSYGLLLTALAVGQTAASLIVGGLTPGGRLGLRIALAQILAGACVLLALPASHWAAMAAILVAYGACTAPLTIWAQTLRMGIVPAAMRGRAFAFLRMLMQSGRPIGGALAGIAIDPGNLAGAVVLSALFVGVPGLVGLCVRDLRQARPPV